jgi:hypothetical protein
MVWRIRDVKKRNTEMVVMVVEIFCCIVILFPSRLAENRIEASIAC